MFDSKPKKILLAGLTIWPIIYIGGFILFAFVSIVFMEQGSKPPKGMPAAIIALFAFHCATMAEMFLLAVIYIVHAVKNPSLKQEMRIIWVMLLLMGGILAMPIYWYLYIWRSPEIPKDEQDTAVGKAL